ncbi:MAG: ATP-binding protein [Cyclobacteriaceae bacterium]|nr:ATP-binding protein [Cyclobacteriaceae bacterium]
MSWIERYPESIMEKLVVPGKVAVLYGPRRTGKTSLIEKYVREQTKISYFAGTGDDITLREILSSQNKELIISTFRGYNLIVIDEAQRVPQIGWGLKLLIDHLPGIRIIATGSSSFELSGQVGEPLTGRSKTSVLYPVSILELTKQFGPITVMQQLPQYLIYGCYPEVLTANNLDKKKDYLIDLRNSYLFKDILELENIQNSMKLTHLLKALAFQIGNEVSHNELANLLGIAKQTVERYLDLLEKTFIIKRVYGFSRNLRKEINKTSRYYFYDNGIRNALINNFNSPDSRMDTGMLWENFCVMERLKKQSYHNIYANNYFWRTYDRQEIDHVEEREGNLFGYEMKWDPKKKVRTPKAWLKAYPDSEYKVVNRENFLDFLT